MARRRRSNGPEDGDWWDTWSTRASGTLGEIVALACGLDPDDRDTRQLISYETVVLQRPPEADPGDIAWLLSGHSRPHTTDAKLRGRWKRFEGLLRAADSAVKVADLPTRHGHIKTADFAVWAESSGYKLPPHFPRSKQRTEETGVPQTTSKPLHTKERTTLLKIIGVLATEAKLPDEPYKAAKSIVTAAATLDVSISENSVAAALKAARGLVGGAQKD